MLNIPPPKKKKKTERKKEKKSFSASWKHQLKAFQAHRTCPALAATQSHGNNRDQVTHNTVPQDIRFFIKDIWSLLLQANPSSSSSPQYWHSPAHTHPASGELPRFLHRSRTASALPAQMCNPPVLLQLHNRRKSSILMKTSRVYRSKCRYHISSSQSQHSSQKRWLYPQFYCFIVYFLTSTPSKAST